MPHVRTPLPVALRTRPFTVAEARELGVSTKRLRSSDLHAPFRGVRVSRGLAWNVRLRAQCVLLATPEGSVVVGDDAVELLGLPTPFGARAASASDVVVAVAVSAVKPRLKGVGVRGHRLHPEAPTWLTGEVRVPSPEDLWAERCADLDSESAIALGDGVLRRLEDDRARMTVAVERLPVEQQPAARAALALVRFKVCSPVETRLRLLLLRAGVPEPSHFAAQIPRQGEARIWPDLQWESVRVAVEVDGPHHGEEPQHESDIRRNRRTKDHGWTQVVVSSREVMKQPAMVVAVISAELRKAGLRW